MSGLIGLSSHDFEAGGTIPERFSVDGGNAVPTLHWDGMPEGTAELAVLCEDPDTGVGTWVHWLVAGIDPSNHEIVGGALPAGAVQGINDFGECGYGGPQPVPGTGAHRYFFVLYALMSRTGLRQGFEADELRRAVIGNELARGVLLGTFER
jgi:Raf kinase inhibitor-like YbhB/YbcL family protein